MTKCGRSISRTRNSVSISCRRRAAGCCKIRPAPKTCWRRSAPCVRRHECCRCELISLRQGGLGETISDALKIFGILVWQDARALHQREIRIHFEKLRPCRARLVRASEMAIAGCQQHAAGVGAGIAGDAVDELLGGDLVLFQAEISLL